MKLTKLSIIALLSMPLAAQVADEDLQRLLETSSLGSASKRAQGEADAPADVAVLSARELRSLGYQTLADALGGVAGFRTNHDRAYQNIGVRGLYLLGDQNTRLLVMIDGHVLNSPADTGSSKFGEDLGLPLEAVDRIEIIRGPASSMYGNNALFGVVNVVTRQAATFRRGGQVVLGMGSEGAFSLWGGQGFQVGSLQVSVSGGRFQRLGSRVEEPLLAADRLPRDLDQETRSSGQVRIQGENWSFSGQAMRRRQGLALAPWGSEVGSSLNAYENLMAFGDFRWEPRLGDLEMLVRVFGDRNEFRSTFAYGAKGDFREEDPDRGLGVEVQARMPLGTAFHGTVGTEQRWNRFRGLTASQREVRTAVDHGTGNTYLQLEWTPSHALRLVGGVQWAQRRVDKVAYRLDDGPTEAGEPVGRHQAAPRLAVIWQPSAADTLKLLYSQGFRYATIFEQYYTDRESSLPQPGIRPERLVTTEALWQRQWGAGIESRVSHNRFGWDHIIQVGVGVEDLQQYVNLPGQARGRATEAEGTFRAGRWHLSAQVARYDWQDAEGRDLPNVAHVQAGLKAVYRVEDWSGALEVRHVGAREAQDGLKVGASTTLRASLRRDWSQAWVQATVEDLGQARPQDLVALEYGPVRTVTADGRNARLVVGVRF